MWSRLDDYHTPHHRWLDRLMIIAVGSFCFTNLILKVKKWKCSLFESVTTNRSRARSNLVEERGLTSTTGCIMTTLLILHGRQNRDQRSVLPNFPRKFFGWFVHVHHSRLPLRSAIAYPGAWSKGSNCSLKYISEEHRSSRNSKVLFYLCRTAKKHYLLAVMIWQ